jgi:hypothetical protein
MCGFSVVSSLVGRERALFLEGIRRQIEQTGILDDDDEGADWILNCAPRE